jgi:hypothetical protein
LQNVPVAGYGEVARNADFTTTVADETDAVVSENESV